MTNVGIIEALRYCGNDQECSECPLRGEPPSECFKMMRDAADALEAAEKRIDELEGQAKNYRNDKMREDDPLRPMWPNWD